MPARLVRYGLFGVLLAGLAAWGGFALLAPPDFEDWLAEGRHAGDSARYENFLRAHGVGDVRPLPALLSAERDWRRCGTSPWQLPPEAQWPQMVPTLRLLQELQARDLVSREDGITSSFRDAALNRCAGGSSGSRHLDNNALDLRLAGDDPEPRLAALCRFWQARGKEFAFGLGIYGDGQIHIDSRGHRSWGPDYSSRSSPCRRTPQLAAPRTRAR